MSTLILKGDLGLRDPFLPAGFISPLITQQDICLLSASSSFEAGLIRLLAGTVIIEDSTGEFSYRQQRNLLVSGGPVFKGKTPKSVRLLLRSLGISIKSTNNCLRRTINQQSYYLDLVLEIAEFYVRSRKGQHLAAFFHIYRFLERVSFAFPVVYASATLDYRGAFDALRSYVSGKDAGELNFFQKFQETAIDRILLDSPTTFDLTGLPNSAVQVMQTMVDPRSVISRNGEIFEIRGGGIVTLIINLRNRLFHFSSNHTQNIRLSDLNAPDSFFRRLNFGFINWLGVLYSSVLIKRCS